MTRRIREPMPLAKTFWSAIFSKQEKHFIALGDPTHLYFPLAKQDARAAGWFSGSGDISSSTTWWLPGRPAADNESSRTIRAVDKDYSDYLDIVDRVGYRFLPEKEWLANVADPARLHPRGNLLGHRFRVLATNGAGHPVALEFRILVFEHETEFLFHRSERDRPPKLVAESQPIIWLPPTLQSRAEGAFCCLLRLFGYEAGLEAKPDNSRTTGETSNLDSQTPFLGSLIAKYADGSAEELKEFTSQLQEEVATGRDSAETLDLINDAVRTLISKPFKYLQIARITDTVFSALGCRVYFGLDFRLATLLVPSDTPRLRIARGDFRDRLQVALNEIDSGFESAPAHSAREEQHFKCHKAHLRNWVAELRDTHVENSLPWLLEDFWYCTERLLSLGVSDADTGHGRLGSWMQWWADEFALLLEPGAVEKAQAGGVVANLGETQVIDGPCDTADEDTATGQSAILKKHLLILKFAEGSATSAAALEALPGYAGLEADGDQFRLSVYAADDESLMSITGSIRRLCGGVVEVTSQSECLWERLPVVPKYEWPKLRDLTFAEFQVQVKQPDLMLLATTEIEALTIINKMKPGAEFSEIWCYTHNSVVYHGGKFGAYEVVLVLSKMGSGGRDGSTLTTERAIQQIAPKAIIVIGIAFGMDRTEQRLGDVVIAESLQPYELQKRQSVGGSTKIIPREFAYPSSRLLAGIFRTRARGWKERRCLTAVKAGPPGLVLSGEKLVNDPGFKAELAQMFPLAKGGEMEGAGAYAAADGQAPIILVKSICDWADGTKDDDGQPFAIHTAVSLCHHILSLPDVLIELDIVPGSLQTAAPVVSVSQTRVSARATQSRSDSAVSGRMKKGSVSNVDALGSRGSLLAYLQDRTAGAKALIDSWAPDHILNSKVEALIAEVLNQFEVDREFALGAQSDIQITKNEVARERKSSGGFWVDDENGTPDAHVLLIRIPIRGYRDLWECNPDSGDAPPVGRIRWSNEGSGEGTLEFSAPVNSNESAQHNEIVANFLRLQSWCEGLEVARQHFNLKLRSRARSLIQRKQTELRMFNELVGGVRSSIASHISDVSLESHETSGQQVGLAAAAVEPGCGIKTALEEDNGHSRLLNGDGTKQDADLRVELDYALMKQLGDDVLFEVWCLLSNVGTRATGIRRAFTARAEEKLADLAFPQREASGSPSRQTAYHEDAEYLYLGKRQMIEPGQPVRWALCFILPSALLEIDLAARDTLSKLEIPLQVVLEPVLGSSLQIEVKEVQVNPRGVYPRSS